MSATEWRPGPAGPRHYYHIRYAESADGMAWMRDGTVCLDYATPDEHAFARPWVVRDADMYRMWFAVRGAALRRSATPSPRMVSAGPGNCCRYSTAGSEAWDSEMVEYPCVFDWRGGRYMLYNGNDYGRTGVGLAVLDA